MAGGQSEAAAAPPVPAGGYPTSAGAPGPVLGAVAEQSPRPVAAGDRVLVEAALATVCWVGCLPDKGSQVWVGVDFDDAKRGKHDGSRDGVQYFQARTAKSGSFVKIEKVDRGVSLAAAIARKFDGLDADEKMVFQDYKTGRTKEVLFVGKEEVIERQAQPELLEEVKIVDARVSWCGKLHFDNLAILLIEQSLLAGWEPVVEMLQQLPALRTLSVSQSRVGSVGSALDGVTFPLETLVLNESGVAWSDLEAIMKAFPNLVELHMRSCGLGLPPDGLKCRGVKTLVLDENEFDDWNVLVRVLDAFPDLEALQMNENDLSDKDFPDAIILPSTLTTLSLAGNKIESWETIGKLCGREPVSTQITHMRLAENPLSADLVFRQVVIALMPKLQEMNVSLVRQHERLSAERGLLSFQVQGKPLVAQVDPNGTHCARLTEIHGEGIAGAQEAKSLKDSLILVELVPAAADILGKASVKKKVPGFLDVEEFKVLCHKLFKVPMDTIRLVFHEAGTPLATELVSGDLVSNGIQDGFRIDVCDSRDDFKAKSED
jgi:hypothetical protein